MTVTINLPTQTESNLAIQAKKAGISLNDLIVDILNDAALPQAASEYYEPTADELIAIDEGLRSEASEPFVTFDESLKRARLTYHSWLDANHDKSA